MELIQLKIVLLAAMPSARARIATVANAQFLMNWRSAKRRILHYGIMDGPQITNDCLL